MSNPLRRSRSQEPADWCDGFCVGYLAAFALKNGDMKLWDELRDEYFARKSTVTPIPEGE